MNQFVIKNVLLFFPYKNNENIRIVRDNLTKFPQNIIICVGILVDETC